MIVDLLHRDYPYSIPDWERKRRDGYFRQAANSAEKIQCISGYTARRLVDEYGVQNGKLFLTYLPVLASVASADRLPKKEPIFVYPANFWTHKNHETLLVAYQLYRHIATDPWDLVLTGYLDERAAKLRQLARALLIERHVHFMGHVDEPQLVDLFRRASGLIYPSLHEGFGIPLIEAMCFRIPIVCSDCGSIPEIAGSAALRVDVKNPIELAAGLKRVTEDGGLRERLVLAGEKRLQDFDLSKEVQKLTSALLRAKRDNGPAASLKRYARYFRRGGSEVLARLWTWIGTPVRTQIGSARQRVRFRIYLVKLRLFHLKRRLTNRARSRAFTR
jgi:glycosyltransferase involved in cell wall biosynthesis